MYAKTLRKLIAWFTLCLMLSMNFSTVALAEVSRGTQSNMQSDNSTDAKDHFIVDMLISEDGVIHAVTELQGSPSTLHYIQYDGTDWSSKELDSDIKDDAGATIRISDTDNQKIGIIWNVWDDTGNSSTMYYSQTNNGGSSWAIDKETVASSLADNGSKPSFIFTEQADPTVRALTCNKGGVDVQEYERDSGGDWSESANYSHSNIDCVEIEMFMSQGDMHAILSPGNGGGDSGVDHIKTTSGTWGLVDDDIVDNISAPQGPAMLDAAIDAEENIRFVIVDNESGASSDTVYFASYNGSSWSTQTVATGANVGPDMVGVATDANFYDWVTYFDDNNNDLKFAFYDEDAAEWKSGNANASDLTMSGDVINHAAIAFNPIDQEMVIAGAWLETGDPTYTSNFDKFTITTLPGFYQESKEIASDGQASDFFGGDVAIGTGSDSSDYIIVGAEAEDHDSKSAVGKAYIFKDSSGFSEQDILTASDDDAGDNFGSAVDIDGDYAVIGADEDSSGQGAAYIFERSGSEWTQEAKLTASDGAADDSFGSSVSISGDYVVVGAPMHDADPGTVDDSGAAYFFKRSGDTWTQKEKVVASDEADGDQFGRDVQIDGDYAVVGAALNDNNPGTVDNSGSAYVFNTADSGENWSEQDQLIASDAATNDYLGFSVGISGAYVIAGAYGANEDGGAAYIFKRSGSTWSQQDKITTEYSEANDAFGRAVNIAGSGTIAIVGARDVDGDEGNAYGSAYLYSREGSDWVPTRDESFALDAASSDYYGHSVDLITDTAVVGAYSDTNGNGTDAGAVYVIGQNDTTVQSTGGEEAVPEFKTYMFMITLIIGFAIIKEKYGEELGKGPKLA